MGLEEREKQLQSSLTLRKSMTKSTEIKHLTREHGNPGTNDEAHQRTI